MTVSEAVEAQAEVVACGSVNWNWPGEISVTPRGAVQLLNGSDGLVPPERRTLPPTLFVKLAWNEPLACWSRGQESRRRKRNAHVEMLLVLGMPLTSTVASAYPGGKFHTGKEVNEFVDQFVVSRNVVCCFRCCAIGPEDNLSPNLEIAARSATVASPLSLG